MLGKWCLRKMFECEGERFHLLNCFLTVDTFLLLHVPLNYSALSKTISATLHLSLFLAIH